MKRMEEQAKNLSSLTWIAKVKKSKWFAVEAHISLCSSWKPGYPIASTQRGQVINLHNLVNNPR